jgi:hypothetical protein
MASIIVSNRAAAGAPQNSIAPAACSTIENIRDESAKKALATCIRAWNYAHNKQAEKKGSTAWDCEKAGNMAFLKATPPLCGYVNICAFINCINYASMTGVIIHTYAEHFLANAKLALSTVYHQPKPPAASSDQLDPAATEDDDEGRDDSGGSTSKGGK